jgi:hypothetical protein
MRIRNFGQRFPGGVDQFAQMVAGLPPDLLEDLLLVEALNAQGGMPGGLDGIDETRKRTNFPMTYWRALS